MIEIGIVDDHAIVRSALRLFLSEQVDLRVAGEAASGREAIELVRDAPGLQVLVMDLAMPGQSGMDVLSLICVKKPELGVLILSGYPEEHYAVNLIRLGASGYLNKQCDPLEILKAIRVIALGHRYFTPAVAQLVAQQVSAKTDCAPHEQLSGRELQVFLELAKGASNAEVATDLALSVKTVSTYRRRLIDKMHLKSNSDLTYYALKHSLIQ